MVNLCYRVSDHLSLFVVAVSVTLSITTSPPSVTTPPLLASVSLLPVLSYHFSGGAGLCHTIVL